MAQSRVNCWQCRTYDRLARRCRIGKTNPKTKLDSLTVAEILGPQALCVHNPFREPLILRMRSPERRFVWADSPPRRPGPPMEVEILDEEPDLAPARDAGQKGTP